MHVYPLAKAQLSLSTPFYKDLQAWPTPPDVLLPVSKDARALVMILLNLHTHANLRHVEARSILLYHSTHTECRRARTNGLLHQRNPAVRNAIGSTIIVGGNNLFFE